jgi:hypothetical protein
MYACVTGISPYRALRLIFNPRLLTLRRSALVTTMPLSVKFQHKLVLLLGGTAPTDVTSEGLHRRCFSALSLRGESETT